MFELGLMDSAGALDILRWALQVETVRSLEAQPGGTARSATFVEAQEI